MNSGQLREHLQSRVDAVRERLARAAEASGRHPEDVTLVAASKTQPDAMIAAAFDCGVRHFGENRPEELARRHRVPELAERPIHWHLIGPLQSRKLKLLPPNLTLIQSVDRLKTARLLANTGVHTETPYRSCSKSIRPAKRPNKGSRSTRRYPWPKPSRGWQAWPRAA